MDGRPVWNAQERPPEPCETPEVSMGLRAMPSSSQSDLGPPAKALATSPLAKALG